MSCIEYFKSVVELYRKAQREKNIDINIWRGRKKTISAEVEELTADYINKKNEGKFNIFVDQQIRLAPGRTGIKYLDLILQPRSGSQQIKTFIDLKIDLGFKRNDLYNYCQFWNDTISGITVTDRKVDLKFGSKDETRPADLSEDLRLHIVILALKNSGDICDEISEIEKKFSKVSLYVLSHGAHPNDYSLNNTQDLNGLNIQEKEFDRLMKAIQ